MHQHWPLWVVALVVASDLPTLDSKIRWTNDFWWYYISKWSGWWGKQPGHWMKMSLFYFYSIDVLFVIRGLGLQPQQASALSDTHSTHLRRQSECLFNMLGVSSVLISQERGPLWAETTRTAAEPQVGRPVQGWNSCPPRPAGKCSKASEWMAQVW